MPELLHNIEARLNSGNLRASLTPLFCETLLWGKPQGAKVSRSIALGYGEASSISFTPVARLGGLPVFQVDWPLSRLPNVSERRLVHKSIAATYLENLLIYVTPDGQQAAFVWARQRNGNKVEMRSLPFVSNSPARTTIEQLSELAFGFDELGPDGSPSISQVTHKLDRAFDVDAVTKRFFAIYGHVFEQAEKSILGIEGSDRRLFTQKLFNRLMFLIFLERKGWLTMNGRRDYLRALWEDYLTQKPKEPRADFYHSRLQILFFSGLNTAHEVNVVGIRSDGFLQTIIGQVPYLNGGLFEEDDDDRDSSICVPDEAIASAIEDLFYHFNFTVTESTPLDVEVAVDPEMLGKIFEELVTGRHETGSYYTPKPVVSFMCREALKGYLQTACPDESEPAIVAFVDQHEPADLRNPEAILRALQTIRACDPACGSGAYLLGLLHELLGLRAALFVSRGLDARTVFQRKLEVIQESLYGVDLDPFAVNIARLRLWLSLIVEFEGSNPPPLPNLDFKIEVGDSLLGPDPSGGLQPDLYRWRQIEQYTDLKRKYLTSHGNEKVQLREGIAAMRREIAEWAHPGQGLRGLDWAVQFADVFTREIRHAEPVPSSGFDIVLANPPYVRADAQYRHITDEDERQEAIAGWRAYRKQLRAGKVYHTLHERWDLYIPFLERAYQLIREGGQMAFIIPDAYNAAKYAGKSHRSFTENSRIMRLDFCSDIPLFAAGVTNTITHFVRLMPDSNHRVARYRRWGGSAGDFDQNCQALPLLVQAASGERVFRPDEAQPSERQAETAFRVDGTQSSRRRTETVALSTLCYISKGMVIHSDERQCQGLFKAEDVLVDEPDAQHPVPFVFGKDIVKWAIRNRRYLEWGTWRAPAKFSRPTFPELQGATVKLIAVRTPGAVPKAIFSGDSLHFDASSVGFVPWHYLKGVLNKSIDKTARYRYQEPTGDRELRETLSSRFHPKYLLAIMNSEFCRTWLVHRRRSKLHIYPDDWKELPIVQLPEGDQQWFVDQVDEAISQFERYGYPLPASAAAKITAIEKEIDERVAVLYGL